MMITDAQVHLWAAETPQRPWRKGEKPHRAQPLGSDEMLREMDSAGVARVIIVPPVWEGFRNDLALEAAQQHPGRFAVMGRITPEALVQPQSRGMLAGWRAQPGMLGLRFTFNTGAMVQILLGGHMDWLWAEAEKEGIPIMVLVSHARVSLIDQIAVRHPGLRLIMDHLALTAGRDETAFRDFDKVLAIAKRPNVAAKVSALPCFSSDRYPYPSLHGHIRQALDAFGPRRLFWGTDFSRSPISYHENVTLFTEELPWLGAQDQEWIMGRGVCEWVGWPLP